MFGHSYYHGVIRKYVILFGTYFNDIDIQRFNSAGQRIQTIRVPIAYGPKEKFLVRFRQDPNLDQEVAISLPRMGFEMTGLTYDGSRKLPATVKNVAGVNTVLKTQFTPAPYNINFRLSVFVANADDGVQIIEQIIPYFAPEWTALVNVMPAMSIKMDVPTVLNSVVLEDTYEGDFNTRRALIWNLDFTMKGWIFGAVKNVGSDGLIRRAQVDYHSVAGTNNLTDNEVELAARQVRSNTTPALLANGSPTTNSAASISIASIKPTDDYGIASDIFNYTDGKQYDPDTGRDV